MSETRRRIQRSPPMKAKTRLWPGKQKIALTVIKSRLLICPPETSALK